MTAKPMKSTNDKIEKILAQETNIGIGQPIIEARNQIKQLIKETLQECIGGEEPSSDTDIMEKQYEYGWIDGRNQLRQQAHAKLDELLK